MVRDAEGLGEDFLLLALVQRVVRDPVRVRGRAMPTTPFPSDSPPREGGRVPKAGPAIGVAGRIE